MASIAEDQKHKPWPMKRVVAASSAGTAFEWYDFFIFGSLATTIQKVFSPASTRPPAWSPHWACSPPASPSGRWARSSSA